jgi:hypothetical protein
VEIQVSIYRAELILDAILQKKRPGGGGGVGGGLPLKKKEIVTSISEVR